jgi:hypothetical protein
MADPLSTAANAAAVIGLVNVSFLTAKELYFFSVVNDVSKEVKSLQNKL